MQSLIQIVHVFSHCAMLDNEKIEIFPHVLIEHKQIMIYPFVCTGHSFIVATTQLSTADKSCSIECHHQKIIHIHFGNCAAALEHKLQIFTTIDLIIFLYFLNISRDKVSQQFYILYFQGYENVTFDGIVEIPPLLEQPQEKYEKKT